jgi:pimeloyl-ACP methyl ester carboxylesterase
MRWTLLTVLACLAAVPARARTLLYGPNLEGFAYPYPVQFYAFRTQAQTNSMAYMDVAPDEPGPGAGRTVALLSGTSLCAGSWAATVGALSRAGFRVVVPDQLGLCKSSKPVNYQYSFEQLAANTRRLLDHLSAGRIILIGHGMGGMLAVRYALMYPRDVARLILVDPIGLADWRAHGVLYLTVDERYALKLENTESRIKRYELERFYAGRWKPSYDVWVQMLASLYSDSGRERYAWNQALISDMIFTQPILYGLARLSMPTVLIVGTLDRAQPFLDTTPPAVAARLSDVVELAREAVKRIPHGRLVTLDGVGHVPQIEAPGRFNAVLLQAIGHPPEASRPSRSPAGP